MQILLIKLSVPLVKIEDGRVVGVERRPAGCSEVSHWQGALWAFSPTSGFGCLWIGSEQN